MTSNQYNMPSFGEGLNFSDTWLDLPPQFMGSTTSFGQQEQSSVDVSGAFTTEAHQHHDYNNMMSISPAGLMAPPPPPPQAQQQHHQHQQPQPQSYNQQHSDDVLNAAATLLQNGRPGSSPKTPTDASSPSTRRSVAGVPVGHLRHQPMEEFKEENRKSSTAGTEADHTFTHWMWGSKEKTPHRKQAVSDFQFGSDANFSDVQGYVPEPSKNSAQAMQEFQMKHLECLATKDDPANRGSGSPSGSNGDGSSSTYIKREDDPNAPPRKRRKSKNVRGQRDDVDEDDDDDDNDGSRPGRRRLPKWERSASGSETPSDATATAGKRRKSGVSAAKAARENLTEEQKRENHIRSEQKRRTLIKEGFDDLGELVPGLKAGGFSKSATLTMAADWLDELLRGNKILSMQISALERR